MDQYGAETFGELHAEDYDEQHDPGTTQASVQLLAELIGTRRALELAIGTGRVALPLAAMGVDVSGIDASSRMLAKLREKEAGADIDTAVADIGDFSLPGRFDFIYLVFNTILNLTTQDAQVGCFQSVARHLTPGGCFLVETIVPDIDSFSAGQRLRTLDVGFDSVNLEAVTYDPVDQTANYQRIHITSKGVHLTPLPIRYVWPAELDLMGRLAGMTLVHRWGDWQQGAFTADSHMHVSLYRLDD